VRLLVGLAFTICATACASHPCTPDQAALDSGDPLDGYCAAIDVRSSTALDRADALLAAEGIDRSAIATPAHPTPPAQYRVLVVEPFDITSGHVEEWSPLIDSGWIGAAVVIAHRGGDVVATGGAELDQIDPDGDPSYMAATVVTEAPASPAVELWGTVPCARFEAPSGIVYFFVPRDGACGG
jgi:hypothetical protein